MAAVVDLEVGVVAEEGETDGDDDNGGSGCNERRMRFVNALAGEKVWKTRVASSRRCG